MERRAAHVLIVVALVAACAGSGTNPTAPPAADSPSPAPPAATAAPVPSPTPEPLNLAWISDSSGSGGVPQAYGRHIEADLGVAVEVHDAWTGELSIVGVLDYLRGYNDGILFTQGSGRQKLADLVRDADILVVSGNANRSETPGHPQTGCSPYFEPNPTCEPVSACGPETWQQYEADIVAVVDEIFRIREGRPVLLRTHDWYLPWGPYATWTTCDCVDACVKCWHEFSDAIHRAAATRDVPVAGYFAAFSGPNGAQPVPSAWTWDDVHPSEIGAEALAGVMADLGYDLVAPPGG